MTTTYRERYTAADEELTPRQEQWLDIESNIERQAIQDDKAATFYEALHDPNDRDYLDEPETLQQADDREQTRFFKAAQETIHDPQVQHQLDHEELADEVTDAVFAPLHAQINLSQHQLAMDNPNAAPDAHQMAEHRMSRAAVAHYQQEFQSLLADDSGVDHSDRMQALYAAALHATREAVSHHNLREIGIEPNEHELAAQHDAAGDAIDRAAAQYPELNPGQARAAHHVFMSDAAAQLDFNPERSTQVISGSERFTSHFADATPHWVTAHRQEHPDIALPDDFGDADSVETFLNSARARTQHADWLKSQAGMPEHDWRDDVLATAIANIEDRLAGRYDAEPQLSVEDQEYIEQNCQAIAYSLNH